MNSEQPELPRLGDLLRYGGRKWSVGMVGVTGGERYVWLTRGNEAAMVPAFMLADEVAKMNKRLERQKGKT